MTHPDDGRPILNGEGFQSDRLKRCGNLRGACMQVKEYIEVTVSYTFFFDCTNNFPLKLFSNLEQQNHLRFDFFPSFRPVFITRTSS